MSQGWTWLVNSPVYYYFVPVIEFVNSEEGTFTGSYSSLCRRFQFASKDPELDERQPVDDGDDCPDCIAIWKSKIRHGENA